ncbi:MAG: hypothetical protein EOP32_17550 [Rhodococcus sp. (in: high G+C Gram-positive bacteria)]|nr:MAG: hypothetical protein EOP32_17550 [Rhodococcus sp. (in: high G+C Gram-positive bacteria)]
MRATRSATTPLHLYAAFRRQHPHTAIPADYITERGFRLGRWQNGQRVAHMPGTLPPQRIAQLDAIGFVRSDDDTPIPSVPPVDSKRRRMRTCSYRDRSG